MKNILKLLRWPNLLMIALVQYLIKYSIIESLSIPHFLSDMYFLLGVICSISLAAAGYIINDLHDTETDKLNKPNRVLVAGKVSKDMAWGLFSFFNIVAFISGYVLAQHIEMPGLWLLPVVAAALLYLYAVDLKKRPIIGNMLVSLLTALPIVLVGVYDILPAGTPENAETIVPVFKVIAGFSVFAFFVNFIREIIKDVEDLAGDKNQGYKTLAVILGLTHIKYVLIILVLVLVVFTGYFNGYLFLSDKYSGLYLLLFVNLPLVYLIYKIIVSKESKDFKTASNLVKLIMLTGMLSMAVFTLSINLRF